MAKASTITLSTGRELTLHELAQELTYEGLLEGVPTTKINKRHMDHLIEQQRAKRPTPVYLVAPVEKLIDPLPPTHTHSVRPPCFPA